MDSAAGLAERRTFPSVAVLGAGSLGLAYAGYLAAAGHRVQVLTRSRHADAIRARGGLRVEGGLGTMTVDLVASANPEAIEEADLVILACKAPDTAALLASTQRLGRSVRAAFSIQNGVEKDVWLSDWSAPEVVVGAASMVGASEVGNGIVSVTMPGMTFLGALPSTSDDAVRICVDALAGTKLPVELAADIQTVEWSKLAQAAAGMSVATLSRLYWHQVLLDEDLALLLVQLVREVNQVAAKHGIALTDLAGLLPVATMAQASDSHSVAQVQVLGQRLLDAGATEVRVSMLQSIETGRRIEVETVLGFVCRESARLDLAAPRMESCYRLLRAMDRVLAHGD